MTVPGTETHTRTAPVLLEVKNIDAAYGPVAVLHEVSLAVNAGEIITLIGANGAGKTTVLRTICGLLKPSAGSVTFAGEPLAGVAAHQIVGRGLAMVPEGRRIFPRLSVVENLRLGAWTRLDSSGVADDLDRAFTLFPILAERRLQAGGTLSGGEQQMLAIGRALMARPRLLLMDEPSMGVAPIITEQDFTAIADLNRQGLAILLVEQNAQQALALAHRGYVLESGRIVLKGLASHLAADARVRASYLGGV